MRRQVWADESLSARPTAAHAGTEAGSLAWRRAAGSPCEGTGAVPPSLGPSWDSMRAGAAGGSLVLGAGPGPGKPPSARPRCWGERRAYWASRRPSGPPGIYSEVKGKCQESGCSRAQGAPASRGQRVTRRREGA